MQAVQRVARQCVLFLGQRAMLPCYLKQLLVQIHSPILGMIWLKLQQAQNGRYAWACRNDTGDCMNSQQLGCVSHPTHQLVKSLHSHGLLAPWSCATPLLTVVCPCAGAGVVGRQPGRLQQHVRGRAPADRLHADAQECTQLHCGNRVRSDQGEQCSCLDHVNLPTAVVHGGTCAAQCFL